MNEIGKDRLQVVKVEMSGDGQSWQSQDTMNLAAMFELLDRGERVFARLHHVTRFASGTTSMPRVGGIYELTLPEMQAPRLIPLQLEPHQHEKKNIAPRK